MQRLVEKTVSDSNLDQSVACFFQGNIPGQGLNSAPATFIRRLHWGC
ncbi:hypothetical protein [Nostoc sp. UHCC 0251]|nr:hypothetical protein [Nostoc sp. UHCC 0251]MEA5626557.1 hypothetical protein [Nostoc sp. UHCC 0251]